MYHYYWNTNDSVTTQLVNKMNILVAVLESFATLPATVTVEEGRESNHPNFREGQVLTLKRYKDLHTSNQRAFIDLMREKKYSSSPVSQTNITRTFE